MVKIHQFKHGHFLLSRNVHWKLESWSGHLNLGMGRTEDGALFTVYSSSCPSDQRTFTEHFDIPWVHSRHSRRLKNRLKKKNPEHPEGDEEVKKALWLIDVTFRTQDWDVLSRIRHSSGV